MNGPGYIHSGGNPGDSVSQSAECVTNREFCFPRLLGLFFKVRILGVKYSFVNQKSSAQVRLPTLLAYKPPAPIKYRSELVRYHKVVYGVLSSNVERSLLKLLVHLRSTGPRSSKFCVQVVRARRKCVSQHACGLRNCAFCGWQIGEGVKECESVNHPKITCGRYLDSCVGQPSRVGFALVANYVTLAGDY